MKKILIVLLVLFAVVACDKKDVDPFKAYRGKSASQLFNGGEYSLAHSDYAEATKQLEALDAIYPFGPYARQGQLDLIYAYYMNDDESSAIAAADRYARLYPRGPNTDYAYYMKGIIGFTEGLSWLQKMVGSNPGVRDVTNLQQSFSAFSLLVHQFPDSQYVPDSLAHMAYIRNLMAQREVLIAQFYMGRRAYVAAANRAAYVVKHYEGSPEVPKALAIMVNAYHQLKLTKMANDTYRILAASYPNSEEYQRLRKQ